MSDKNQTVLIQAVPGPGFHFHGEAHRLWPSDKPVKVTVLSQEDDGPEVPHKVKRDGHDVVEMRPDPHVIGQRSFRALKANPRIRILSDGQSIADATTEAAKAEVQAQAAEIVELKGRVAQLEADNDALLVEIAQLRKGGEVTKASGAEETKPAPKGEVEAKKADGKKADKDKEGSAKG